MFPTVVAGQHAGLVGDGLGQPQRRIGGRGRGHGCAGGEEEQGNNANGDARKAPPGVVVRLDHDKIVPWKLNLCRNAWR